jgi:hypothetical protein
MRTIVAGNCCHAKKDQPEAYEGIEPPTGGRLLDSRKLRMSPAHCLVKSISDAEGPLKAILSVWRCQNNPRPGVIRLTRYMSGDLSVEISCADSIDQRSKTSARLPQRPSSWLQDPAGRRLAIASPASGFQEGGQRRTRRHFALTIRTRWLNQRWRGSRWRRPASRCGAA